MATPKGSHIPAGVQYGGAAFFGLCAVADGLANVHPIPHLDATGLGLATLAAIALFLPYIARLRVSSDSIEVEALQAATESTDDLEAALETINAISDVHQDWMSQVNWLNRQLQLRATTDEDAVRIVLRFCRKHLQKTDIGISAMRRRSPDTCKYEKSPRVIAGSSAFQSASVDTKLSGWFPLTVSAMRSSMIAIVPLSKPLPIYLLSL
jgi:hypothetical protein